MIALRFGPLRYLVSPRVGALPQLQSYVDDELAGGRQLEVEGPWSAVAPILADAVARDSISAHSLVLHAGAIDAASGAVLLLAPPGTGKSTRVAAAGARALADNSVLIRVEPTLQLWTLPFAGGDAIASPSASRERIALVAALGRGDTPGARSLPDTDLMFTITSAIVWPVEDARERAVRARLAFEFAGKIRGIRLDTPPDAGYLSVVDRLLSKTANESEAGALVRRSPSATFREIDGQVVVISTDVHRVRLLNTVGAFIWQRCDGRSIESIVDDVCSEFAVTRETALADVVAFVQDMKERALVTVTE